MSVHLLGTYGYRGRLDHEWGESIPQPTWPEIEAALRRLDASEFAGVVLHQNDHPDAEPATDALAVTGGPGCYLVTCTTPGRGELTIINPENPDSEKSVGVCRRDQGVWVPERKVCRDLEVVLNIARHYAATGQPWPGIGWR